MDDESILLKIKRQFKKDESIAALLKIIESLRVEIGVLNSELAEKKYELNKLRTSASTDGLKTQKEWLKDDLINEMNTLIKTSEANSKAANKRISELEELYGKLYNSVHQQ